MRQCLGCSGEGEDFALNTKESYELVDVGLIMTDLVTDVVAVAASWRWAKGARQNSVTVKPRQEKAKERTAKFTIEEYEKKRNEEKIDLEITVQGIAACTPWSSTTMGRAV